MFKEGDKFYSVQEFNRNIKNIYTIKELRPKHLLQMVSNINPIIVKISWNMYSENNPIWITLDVIILNFKNGEYKTWEK